MFAHHGFDACGTWHTPRQGRQALKCRNRGERVTWKALCQSLSSSSVAHTHTHTHRERERERERRIHQTEREGVGGEVGERDLRRQPCHVTSLELLKYETKRLPHLLR